MKSVKIQVSKNYTLFHTINGNRNLNKKKIDNIISDIKNGLNLLPYVPVIVYDDDQRLMIVDGQHRFEVSKKLNYPVYFVVCDQLTLRQMATINNRQDKWKMTDFLNCYIKIGIEDYKHVDELMKEFKVGISTAIDLLMLGKISQNSKASAMFKDGEFKCKYLDETKELLELNRELFNEYSFNTDRHLITALQEIKKKGLCNFQVLKEKLKQHPMLLERQASYKDYIYNIERVYNHRNQQRKIIF